MTSPFMVVLLLGAPALGNPKHHEIATLIAKKNSHSRSSKRKVKKKDVPLPNWKEITAVRKLTRKQGYYLNKSCGHYNYKIHTLTMEKHGLMIQYDIPFRDEKFNRGSMVLAQAGAHLGRFGSKKEAQTRIKEINSEIRNFQVKAWNTAKTILNKEQIEEAKSAARERIIKHPTKLKSKRNH